ncbi:MAG TPA: Ig-like domain-containing protein [Bryobacteraceae bacterium]|nr:Ig-like domain-containing protein [Bryobacteraceae bacterium]
MTRLCFLPALCASIAYAADTSVVSLFPSDTLTVSDPSQKTGIRVNLPLPDCSIEPSTCAEISAINQLDGFNINPRIAVTFSGPVNTDSLRAGIFFVAPSGDQIAINQVIYDPGTFTVYAKPDNVLAEDTTYSLNVSNSVLDAAGDPVGPASTTFTTLSATAWMAGARADLMNIDPAVAPTGSVNTYRLSDIRSGVWHRQTHAEPSVFQDVALPIAILQGVDRIAFASYQSPNYLNASQTIDAVPSGSDPGTGNGSNQIYFHALLPATPKPDAGYPVVIYGHGLSDSRFGGPSAVASVMASAGFAVVAINAVGHGYGVDSTVQLTLNDGSMVEIPAPGRTPPDSFGTITPPLGCIVLNGGAGLRDCLRQTTLDIMQLVRAIQSGMDLDGDGAVDLDPTRIYYVGQSLGSLYGTLLNAMEPNISAAALNVGGGSQVDITRWSPSFHSAAVLSLAIRQPSLLNAGLNYNENYVLRDQPVVVNDVAGAIPIQNYFERVEWIGMIGDPLGYAAYLAAPKNVLFLFGIGDRTVPNPTESALVRAAGMQQSTWVYRHDLARMDHPELAADPHTYLTNVLGSPAAVAIAIATQTQIAGFFASGGTMIPDPNSAGLMYFEIPATLPEILNFQ